MDRSGFIVVAELAAGPGFNFAPIEKFLGAARQAGSEGLPAGFDFVGVTVPQSPGGVANLEPMDVLTRVKAADLIGDLDFIPHVSCKDHNSDAIASSLVNFRAQGIESVLALTGDKPVRSSGVFELESASLLKLIQGMNDAAYLKAGPGQWDRVQQFFPGAAVSPFKYTEASQMQQYYKMEKKIACGARFLITQLGYDWRKSLELMRYLDENGVEIPVLGNVYLLTTATPAPRLMHEGKLPGCFVSDDLLTTLQRESVEQHIERAAQQVAMYKAIGAAGVDVGGLLDFDTFLKVLDLAGQIGDDWETYKDNLCWPGGKRFYLYDDDGRRTVTGGQKKKLRQRSFDLTHRLILDPEPTGFRLFRGLLGLTGPNKGKGFAYKSFTTLERTLKYAAFDCQDCGDCHLPENFGYCTLGGCEKGLSNAPCGDSTVDGQCGNNAERQCTGERIYEAAAAEPGGTERLRQTISRPRDPALRHTSSILNYLFGRDHTGRSPLISIGDLIDASHPKTVKVMQEVLDLGQDVFVRDTGPIGYLRALIRSQVSEGADYVAVNVDALSDEEGQLAVKMMRQYVRLVRQWSGGVPVCIDSRFEEVWIAGLTEWYNTNQAVRPPLLSAVRPSDADKLMSLRKEHDFAFVALLGAPAVGCPGIDEAFNLATQCFDQAVSQYGFAPEQIFFDPIAVPLAKDEPIPPDGRSRTNRAFKVIERIKGKGAMQQSHCVLRTNDAGVGLPGRAIGVCRAYVARAMECGLDAAFMNPASHFGEGPADPKLLELVDAYARMDGALERTQEAKERMAKFCAETQKPRRPASPPVLAKS